MNLLKISISVLIIGLAGLLIQCAHKQPESTLKKPAVVRTSYSPRTMGPDIESAVKDLLAVANLESISASVNEETGFVSLYGPISSPETRTKIVEIVKNLKGVNVVRDDLYMTPPPVPSTVEAERSLMSYIRDSWVYLVLLVALGLLIISTWRTGFWTRRAKEPKRFLATASES